MHFLVKGGRLWNGKCSLKLPFPNFSSGLVVCGTALPPWQRLRALVAACTGAQHGGLRTRGNGQRLPQQQWDWGGRLKEPVNSPSNTSTPQGRTEEHSNELDNCFVSRLTACRYSSSAFSPLGRGWLVLLSAELGEAIPTEPPKYGCNLLGAVSRPGK